MPDQYHESFDRLSRTITEVDRYFAIWLSWYQARLRGDPFDFQSEAKRIFLPQEIESQGATSINRYVSEILEVETLPLNRMRAIFIGHGGTGKTSLIRA